MDVTTLGVVVGIVATIVGGVAAVNRLTRRGAVTDAQAEWKLAEVTRKLDSMSKWFEEPGPEDDHLPLPAMARRALVQIEAVRAVAQEGADRAGRAFDEAHAAQEAAERAEAASTLARTELRDHMAEEEREASERLAMLGDLNAAVSGLQLAVAALSNPKED